MKMPDTARFLEFRDREQASLTAAKLMARDISDCLGGAERCAIVVSGGTTPGRCFDHLSRTPLPWSRVTVIPSDERWVPVEHADSNEKMIRNRLLSSQAGEGEVLPLFRGNASIGQAPGLIAQDLSALPLPFACVLLGMGADGHFASLFPDFDGLADALDPTGQQLCTQVRTAGSPHLRISLCLPALLNTRHTVLLIFGADKHRVLQRSLVPGSGYPIAALLQHHASPMTVVWSP